MNPSDSSKDSSTLQLVCAAGLMLWRLILPPPMAFWQDWVVVISGYWILSVLIRDERRWAFVTVVSMAFLLGIFLHAEFRNSLRVLGIHP